MCKSSVAETPTARNRRLFLAALAAGIQAHDTATEGVNRVDSKSGGAPHYVLVTVEGSTRTEYCDCDWGKREGLIVTQGLHSGQAVKTGRPCSHILLTRWAALSAEQQTAIRECDPEIDAALVTAAASALVAPPVVTPSRRRERVQEAW